MNALRAREELRRMRMKDIFRLASEQKISECLVGAKACSLFVRYKEFHFCISELFGKGCVYEVPEQLKTKMDVKEMPLLPWDQAFLNNLHRHERKGIPFEVYWRDESTRAMILLGEIIERRKKERKNNLRDLLAKARKEFSGRVSNPALIFLLGP